MGFWLSVELVGFVVGCLVVDEHDTVGLFGPDRALVDDVGRLLL